METKKVVLQIEGMSCLSCAATVEKSLSEVGGVSNPAERRKRWPNQAMLVGGNIIVRPLERHRFGA